MAFKFDHNPFAQTPSPQDAEVTRVRRIPELNRELSPAKPDLEHIATMEDLDKHLQVLRQDLRDDPQAQRLLSEACDGVVGCDPWKYEPYLIDELFRERRRNADHSKINKLRGLIRAGSWNTYPRQTATGVLDDLHNIRQLEQHDWEWRLRNADPDTAKEIKQDRAEQTAEFQQIAGDIAAGKLGDDLEDSTRHIENLLGHTWYKLKKLMSANGLTWDQAETEPATSALYAEIMRLRPLRNFIYYRLLYPKWARYAKTEK